MLAAAATPTAPAAIAAAADVNMVGSGQQMDGWDEEEEEIEDGGEEAGGRGYGSGRTSKSRQSSAVPTNVLSASSTTPRVPLHPSSSTTTTTTVYTPPSRWTHCRLHASFCRVQPLLLLPLPMSIRCPPPSPGATPLLLSAAISYYD